MRVDTAGLATHWRLDDQRASESFHLEAAASEAAFAAAEDTAEGWVTIAGRQLHLRIAGHDLAHSIFGAFARVHRHAARDASATLDVDVWGGVQADAGLPGIVVWDRARSSDGRFFEHATPHVVGWLDRARHRLVARVRSAPRPTLFQPFSGLLAVWLADRGTPAIHAGAVAREGRAILIAGPSGAGKSTVSLSCLSAGFDYLGDDFVVLSSPEGSIPHGVHAVYGTGHLDRDHLVHFPALRGVDGPGWPGDNKVVLRIADRLPDRLALAARVQAIVLPRIVPGAATRLRPAAKSAALLAMIPSSLFVRPSATAAAFGGLAGLADNVPAYTFDLGADVSAIPGVMRDLWSSA